MPLWGGVPAQVIKYRFSNEICKELLKIDLKKMNRDLIVDNLGTFYKEIKSKEDVDLLYALNLKK